jgi:hypothetical protein
LRHYGIALEVQPGIERESPVAGLEGVEVQQAGSEEHQGVAFCGNIDEATRTCVTLLGHSIVLTYDSGVFRQRQANSRAR